MLIVERKKQLKKYVRNVALVAMAFCVAMGLFSAPIFATSRAASPAGLYATARAAAFTEPNDPKFSEQWVFKPYTFMGDAFPYTNIDKAWALMPASAQKLRVAVLDEGFEVDHPDLAANINKNLAWNTHEENNDVSPEQGSRGHGTHVSGIFGAVADNGIGIAGIAKNLAEIVPIKTSYTHSNGQFGVDLAETAKGINYAVANGCKIINMSNGTYYSTGSRHTALDAAVANAISQGVILVAAAGNNNISDTIFPSDHNDVISVTAATQTSEKASYSDYNAQKNIAAPGGGQKEGSSIGKEIYSTVPGGYGEKHGTSMAAPFVSGVLTLMLAANPNLTVDEAKSILYTTAIDLGASGRDDIFGHGLVNAEAAVNKALEMANSGNPGTGGGNNGGDPDPGTGGGNNGGDPGAGTGGGDNSGNSGTGGGDNSGNGGTGGGSYPDPGTGGGNNNGNNPGTGGGDNSGSSGTGGGDSSGTGGGDNSGTGGGSNPDPGTGGGNNNNGNTPGTGGSDNSGNPGAGGGNNSGDNSGGGTNTGGGNGNNPSTGGDNNVNGGGDTTSAKKPARYKITFKVNGGKKLKAALMNKTVLCGEKYGKLPKPKRSNYKFLGWYTKKTGGIKITKKSIVQIQKNHKLYAHWRRK
jgi:uncharacterized repeat protein (TIGR02543 family)